MRGLTDLKGANSVGREENHPHPHPRPNPTPMSTASSPSSSFPYPFFLPRTAAFTPISEREEEGEEEEEEEECSKLVTPSPQKRGALATQRIDHHLKALHHAAPSSTAPSQRVTATSVPKGVVVDHIGCRPSSSATIVDSSSGSPTGVFHTLLSSLSCKNSIHSYATSSSSSLASARHSDHELGKRFGIATKERDEALLEVSRLRETVLEMEKKVARLESYSNDLRSALHRCGGGSAILGGGGGGGALVDPSFPVSEFLGAVTESRTMARHLARFIVAHIRQAGRSRMLHRISLMLLRPSGVDLSSCQNVSKTGLVLYTEGALSWFFFEDFESPGFEQNGSDRMLDPSERCESNKKAYRDLQGLSWEEVLRKGTKHHSKEFSRFCDRKMRELVEILGWAQSWPGPILQAFFRVAKWIWLVHLLSRSVHPMVPVFRVRKGELFNPGYMEDASAGWTGTERGGPARVEMMVSPGFYVYGGVIKCKVICTS